MCETGSIPKGEEWWKSWTKDNNALWAELQEAKAGKRRDIEMVLDALRFVRSRPQHNIVAYSLNRIRQGHIRNLYSELQTIRQVGPKVGALFLRDLVLCFELRLSELPLSEDDYVAVQPVDTWVRQVVHRLEICTEHESDELIVSRLIEISHETSVNPCKLNAGVWYLGANSLVLLLDHIRSGCNIA